MAEDADALGDHRLVQPAPQILVEARQDLGAAIDQRRLDAEAMEDIGEFDGNIAAAGDHDRFRQLFKMKGLVGGDAEFVTGKGCMRVRPSAGGDDDRLCRHRLSGLQQPDRMGIDEFRARFQDLGIGAGETFLVEAFQPGDFNILGRHQLLPVEAAFADRPAETRRILEMLMELRGIDEELFRHAAADDAGAAVAILLGDRHFLAERGGDTGAAHTS